MNTTQQKRLHHLENRIETLRKQLGFSPRGEMIFQAPKDNWSAADVVVEADGQGGAKLLIVEGNYPADYTTYKECSFNTEGGACEAAEQLIARKKSSS